MAELGWRDVLFSLKTFAAAMLAVYIAFRIPLPQPSWAMLTVYVVSQPLAGMVLSKSIFRVWAPWSVPACRWCWWTCVPTLPSCSC